MTTVEEVETESTDGLFDVEPDSKDDESGSTEQAAGSAAEDTTKEDATDGEPADGEPAEEKPAEAVVEAVIKEEAPTFTFTPKDGGDPITVASVKVAIPEGKQRWFFWKLRKLQGLEQPIFWLDQAGIPDHLQEKIMLLPDQEWARFYEEWMRDGGASPGE